MHYYTTDMDEDIDYQAYGVELYDGRFLVYDAEDMELTAVGRGRWWGNIFAEYGIPEAYKIFSEEELVEFHNKLQ